jgi:hypothetical protein
MNKKVSKTFRSIIWIILILVCVTVVSLIMVRRKGDKHTDLISLNLVYKFDSPEIGNDVKQKLEDDLVSFLKQCVAGKDTQIDCKYSEGFFHVQVKTDKKSASVLRNLDDTLVCGHLLGILKIAEMMRRHESSEKLKQFKIIVDRYMEDKFGNLNKTFPSDVSDFASYDTDSVFTWPPPDIEYCGAGKRRKDTTQVLAYDRKLAEEGHGTNVLFVGIPVTFINVRDFEKYNIILMQR